MKSVDCMACLTLGMTLPMGTEDAGGIVHYARWGIGEWFGCFKLCDFDGDQARGNVTRVDVNKLFSVEEP